MGASRPSAERAVGGHGAVYLLQDAGCNNASAEFPAPAASSGANKRKRRPAGTPDPGAEVVALSPKTLMESDRYVCEICNQGFQRDQNLQMHRRRHKVPWKLLKRPSSLGSHKRVYVCPERSCLHHDPSHALGDLVGIKKHYRRKHCIEKQWKCSKCSKGYAVQSDYKAHLKTCGTRGHCCDCGRVFSRVESFIEHQDTCSAIKHISTHESEGGRGRKSPLHRNSSESPSQSSDTTQAMIPLPNSGRSDATGRSVDSITRTVVNGPSRRTFESLVGMMPTWLMERRKELQLLGPSTQAQLPESSYSEALALSTMQEIRRDQISDSRSQVTRCSSLNSACPEVSCDDSKSLPPRLTSDDTNTPSFQLSIGPYTTDVDSSTQLRDSPCVDTKPSLSFAQSEVLPLTYHLMQAAGAGERSMTGIQTKESSLGKDLVLSFPGSAREPENTLSEDGKQAVSLSDFLIQAARRLGDPKNETRPTSSQADEPEIRMSIHNDTPYVESTSTSHGERERIQPETDSLVVTTPRRRSLQHSPYIEHETSNVTRKLHAQDHKDIAETELFVASRTNDEAYRQKEIAAAACSEASQAREQARTDIKTAWSDLAAARRTKEQARQETCEAQEELARADLLKRDAKEQLQSASAEKAYAKHARKMAKLQMDMAEAELANAKRLREHAQAELKKAQSLKERAGRSMSDINTSSREHSPLCYSCKAPASDRMPQPNRMTPTPPNLSWTLMTPPTLLNFQQGARGGQQFMAPGSSLQGTNYAENANDLQPALNLLPRQHLVRYE